MTTEAKLSTYWLVVLLNMLFADVFSIMVAIVDPGAIKLPGDVRVVMAIAAVVTNLPILMVWLSRVLPVSINRIANLTIASLSILYVVGGGDRAPHYLIIGTIEVAFLVAILVTAWRWSGKLGS